MECTGGLPDMPKLRWLFPPTPFGRARGVLTLGTKGKVGTILILKRKVSLEVDGRPLNFYCPCHQGAWGCLRRCSQPDCSSLLVTYIDRSLSGDSVRRRHLSIPHGLSLRVQKNTPLTASNRTFLRCLSPCVTADRTTGGSWYQIGTITHLVF